MRIWYFSHVTQRLKMAMIWLRLLEISKDIGEANGALNKEEDQYRVDILTKSF